jgi:hypothetical protein
MEAVESKWFPCRPNVLYGTAVIIGAYLSATARQKTAFGLQKKKSDFRPRG